MYQFIFTGVVHPERANVNVSPIPLEVKNPDGTLICRNTVVIGCSQITAVVETPDAIQDIATLKNHVADSIRTIVDIVGYMFGCGYEVEIRQVIEPVTGISSVFGVNVPVLDQYGEKHGVRLQAFFALLADERGRYLQRALGDLRDAIGSARDTAFFCYRAIESLRQFYVVVRGAKDKAESWELLRTELNVSKSDIDEIKRLADPVRHGENIFISDSERANALVKSWDIVKRFVDSAKLPTDSGTAEKL